MRKKTHGIVTEMAQHWKSFMELLQFILELVELGEVFTIVCSF